MTMTPFNDDGNNSTYPYSSATGIRPVFYGQTIDSPYIDRELCETPEEKMWRIMHYQDERIEKLKATCDALKEMLIHNSEESNAKINTMKEELRVMKNRLNRAILNNSNNCKN